MTRHSNGYGRLVAWSAIAIAALSLVSNCKQRPSAIPPGGWIDEPEEKPEDVVASAGGAGAPSNEGAQQLASDGGSSARPENAKKTRASTTKRALPARLESDPPTATRPRFAAREPRVDDQHITTVSATATLDATGVSPGSATIAYSYSQQERIAAIGKGQASEIEVSFGDCFYEFSMGAGSQKENLPVSDKRYRVRPRGKRVEVEAEDGSATPTDEQKFLEELYAESENDSELPPVPPDGPIDRQRAIRLSPEQLKNLFTQELSLRRVELVFVETADCDDNPCGHFEVDFEASFARDEGEAVIVAEGDAYILFSGRRLARLEAEGSIELSPRGQDTWISGSFELSLTEKTVYKAAESQPENPNDEDHSKSDNSDPNDGERGKASEGSDGSNRNDEDSDRNDPDRDDG